MKHLTSSNLPLQLELWLACCNFLMKFWLNVQQISISIILLPYLDSGHFYTLKDYQMCLWNNAWQMSMSEWIVYQLMAAYLGLAPCQKHDFISATRTQLVAPPINGKNYYKFAMHITGSPEVHHLCCVSMWKYLLMLIIVMSEGAETHF